MSSRRPARMGSVLGLWSLVGSRALSDSMAFVLQITRADLGGVVEERHELVQALVHSLVIAG